ncbi:MAG: nucleotidyltransferase [Candidatus Natronoplasma sp.]
MKCPHCNYNWEPRKEKPKACPRCKRRLDYPIKTDKLSKAEEIERGFQRDLYVMSILTERLEEEGITPVVIGGAAVEFYTRDWYSTSDIDLAIDKSKRDEFYEVMEEFDFEKDGSMWVREDLNLYVEIPGDINDIDEEKLTEVETEAGKAYVIGLEDIIFDRIQAAEHWESKSDREQAVRIGASFYDEIDWDYVRKRCSEELSEEMLDEVLEEIEDEKDKA